MKIKALTELDPQAEWWIQGLEKDIPHVTDDSRSVQPGSLFLCYSIQPVACAYIQQVLDAGAGVIAGSQKIKAFITQHFSRLPPGIDWVSHDDFKQFASKIAAHWFSGRPPIITAATGTNGKTSTVQFLYQLWALKGIKGASLGTLGVQCRETLQLEYPPMTTPSPLALYQTLDHLSHRGITHVALEASSHGLHQKRLQHVAVEAAGFTNLTQDHLDYHQTMEQYFQAKAHLFTDLLRLQENAVLNADDPYAQRLLNSCPGALTYSVQGKKTATIAITQCRPHPTGLYPTGQWLKVRVFDQEFEIIFPHLGQFLVANALCAFGLFLKTVPPSTCADIILLEQLKAVKGRLQWVGDTLTNAKVFIDYAHTPDGLENVLKSLRSLPHNRLMVVFGCGGNRDPDKRIKMGQVAELGADWVGITDDNPRTEPPEAIRHQIKKGCPKAHDLGDRESAIAQAIAATQSGDILLIAGKGHETVQTIGTVDYHFDDQKMIEKYLK